MEVTLHNVSPAINCQNNKETAKIYPKYVKWNEASNVNCWTNYVLPSVQNLHIMSKSSMAFISTKIWIEPPVSSTLFSPPDDIIISYIRSWVTFNKRVGARAPGQRYWDILICKKSVKYDPRKMCECNTVDGRDSPLQAWDRSDLCWL